MTGALARLKERWPDRWRPRAPDGMAKRLLALTAVFTLAVQLSILLPSAASFHERWLRDRLQAAELASVGVEALPYSAVEDDTAAELMRIGGVQAVVVGEQGCRHVPELALGGGGFGRFCGYDGVGVDVG